LIHWLVYCYFCTEIVKAVTMDFRTRIEIPKQDISMNHATRVMLFGSCFAEHIGRKLLQYKFKADVNPFGILYNPFSVSQSIKRLLSGTSFTEEDLLFHQEMYHSLMHHGQFSATDKQACLNHISNRFEKAAEMIRSTELFLITFGSAYAYRWKETGEIAGNCHKIPADRFHRVRLSVEEIAEEWGEVIRLCRILQPEVKFIFTVSPIRHWKDGAHENQLSKSILHLAIDILQNRYREHVGYFPAYEVMMDELRDYRFYDEDMIHPSSLAGDYIWQRFTATYFSEEPRHVNEEWSPIRRALDHRPLNPETEAYRTFVRQTALRLEAFAMNHPEISCEQERALLPIK